MKYSEKALSMLEEAISGKLEDFWDFSFDFNALLGKMKSSRRGGTKKILKCSIYFVIMNSSCSLKNTTQTIPKVL